MEVDRAVFRTNGGLACPSSAYFVNFPVSVVGRRPRSAPGDWRELYGKVNEHNGWVPRDYWLADWEKQAIIEFHLRNPLEGYRPLTLMQPCPLV